MDDASLRVSVRYIRGSHAEITGLTEGVSLFARLALCDEGLLLFGEVWVGW